MHAKREVIPSRGGEDLVRGRDQEMSREVGGKVKNLEFGHNNKRKKRKKQVAAPIINGKEKEVSKCPTREEKQ